MSIRKTWIVCVLLSLCCLVIVSCAATNAGSVADEEELKQKEAGRLAPIPTIITANGYFYTELDLETIQDLNLAVESCDGLTEIGKLNSNWVFREYTEDGNCVLKIGRTIRKNKKDYDAIRTSAVIGDTLYAHPNPRYPNLLVAILDGEPAIFQIGAVEDNRKVSVKTIIQENYGLDDAEKIRKVCVRCYPAPQAGIVETTVTDRTELEVLFDAIDMISCTGEQYRPCEPETYPLYECSIEMKNGFSRVIEYWLNDNVLTCDEIVFEGDDALTGWIVSHGKNT